ncbi:MAG: hypothetical protein RLZZ217_1108 [Planctomycetota bacterium]
MLDQRGLKEPHVDHALDGAVARCPDVVGHADMKMARAVIGGRERGATRCIGLLPMVVIGCCAVVMVPIVRAVRMHVLMMGDARAAAAVDRDAQHPSRRHAGADLREQEERQEDACDRGLHAVGAPEPQRLSS